MKNIKLKNVYNTLLLSGLFLTGTFIPTVVCNQQSSTVLSTNNSKKDVNLDVDYAPASCFFTGTNISGEISYTFDETLQEITIHGYSSSKGNVFTVTNPTFLSSITIPNTSISNVVKIKIASNAFSFCQGLSGEITFSSAVIALSDQSFDKCEYLTGVDTRTAGFTSIPNAFYMCKNIAHVFIGEQISSLGAEAFYENSITSIDLDPNNSSFGLQHGSNGKSLFLVSGSDKTGSIWDGSIPEGNLAYGNVDLQEASISVIEPSMFKGCNITSVAFNSETTKIPNSAFEGCINLNNVIFPLSLTTIGDYAFMDTSITSVDIQLNISSIGYDAFANCPIELIVLNSSNSYFSLATNNSSKASILIPNTGIQEWDEVTSPVGCLITGDVYFRNVTSTSLSQFLMCSGIKTLKFGSQFTTLNEYSFAGCESITSIDLSESKVTTIPSSCFAENCALTTISFPSTLKTIQSLSFDECVSLTSFTIPNTVTTIENNILGSCYNLSEIVLSWSKEQIQETNIDSGWLSNINSTNDLIIKVPESQVDTYSKYADQLGISNMIIYDGYEYGLSTAEVFNADSITGTASIRIFGSHIYINNASNISANNLSLKNEIEYNGSTYTVYAIDENAFNGNTNITGSLTIHNGIKEIGANAFNGCTGITTINLDINKSDTTIGNNAFANCTNAKDIYVNDLNQYTWNSESFIEQCGFNSKYNQFCQSGIDASSFIDAENLNGNIVIESTSDNNIMIKDASTISGSNLLFSTNSSLVGIDDSAFVNNLSISGSITLPNTIQKLGANVFEGCLNISTINLNWTKSTINQFLSLGTINKSWLGNLNKVETTIVVPYQLLDFYKEKSSDLGINECSIIPNYTPTPPSPPNKNLALGLGLGIGIPAAIISGIGGFFIYKKVKKSKKG